MAPSNLLLRIAGGHSGLLLSVGEITPRLSEAQGSQPVSITRGLLSVSTGVKQLAMNLRWVPLARWADNSVIFLCHENGREQVRLFGHIASVACITSAAMPRHFHHGANATPYARVLQAQIAVCDGGHGYSEPALSFLLLERFLKELDLLLEPPDIIAGYIASDFEFGANIAGN